MLLRHCGQGSHTRYCTPASSNRGAGSGHSACGYALRHVHGRGFARPIALLAPFCFHVRVWLSYAGPPALSTQVSRAPDLQQLLNRTLQSKLSVIISYNLVLLVTWFTIVLVPYGWQLLRGSGWGDGLLVPNFTSLFRQHFSILFRRISSYKS